MTRNNQLQFTVICRGDHLVTRSLQTSLVDRGGDSCRAPRASQSELLAMRERLFVAHGFPRRLAGVIEATQTEELSSGCRDLDLLSVFLVSAPGCSHAVSRRRRHFRPWSSIRATAALTAEAFAPTLSPKRASRWTLPRRLRTYLADAGFRTVLTRSGDTFVTLDRRVAIANGQRRAIFVSIHFNSAPRKGADGIETFYASAKAKKLASLIQRYAMKTTSGENRGIKRARFYVLRRSRIPAVLIECGFLTNRQDARTSLTGGVAGSTRPPDCQSDNPISPKLGC